MSTQARVRQVGLLAGLVGFVVPWAITFDGLSPEGHRMLSVFLLAIALWVTEAIPLHATAVVIIGLEIVLISDEAVIPTSAGFEAPGYDTFLASLAHPVLILFLGGFFIAQGAAKFGADRNLARVMLRPFGHSPARIVLGVMLITAGLSMFMSNTATTATMMAVMLPVLVGLPEHDRLRTGLALSVPIAANLGGLGTPVGSPPNAIALANLVDAGIRMNFLRWMIATVPFVLVALVGAWVLLMRLFPSSGDELRIEIESTFDRSRPAMIFYATALGTVALWLTEPLHGMNANAVGFLPVVVLLATRVFGVAELHGVQWHVLWLVAGGIALGSGVGTTGLDAWLIGLVGWERLPAALLVSVLGLAALALSTIISNSATANLLIPIGMTLAISGSVAVDPVLVAIMIAIGCSLAMALPVSTPPNAVAYSTGLVSTRDLAVTGAAIGLATWALVSVVGPPLWRWWGVVSS